MITHVVMFKLHDPNEAETIAAMLRPLPETIDLIRFYEVGVDIIRNERSWDLSIVSKFDSLETLAAYQEHPEHVKVRDYVKPRMAASAAVDYEGDA